MSAGALVVIGIPAIFLGAKIENQAAVHARFEVANQFERRISDTVVKDIDAVTRQSSLCRYGCASHDKMSGYWKWRLVTANGALLIDLFTWDSQPPRNAKPPRLESYRLVIYGLSPEPGGDLSSAPDLQRTLQALLERFGYPDAARPYEERDADNGNSHYRTTGPGPVLVPWLFAGKERMRAEWQFNMLRTGPFAEEGSWLAER